MQTTISNLMKLEEISSNGLKTLWEKEKLLIRNNFCFSHGAFKRLALETRKNKGWFGKGLTLYHMTKMKTCPFSERMKKINMPQGRNLFFVEKKTLGGQG